jgi:4-hydroxy-4-methyl-2-oxoglutarate aldolase
MPLPHSELLRLGRWSTPTIYNGWERITRHDPARHGFNLAEARDFMPEMGPMVGYAATLVIEPSEKKHAVHRAQRMAEYREYIAQQQGPTIAVVQDLDAPNLYGSFWGEVNATIHQAFGCVGTVVDGGIRDIHEMRNAGFKALARRLCVGHAHSCPVQWGCDVEVFGTPVSPGQLIHADEHGFLAVPPEDEAGLLHAAAFMDANECETVIAAARGNAGGGMAALERINDAARRFAANAQAEFERDR